jgi:hypothetical protein
MILISRNVSGDWRFCYEGSESSNDFFQKHVKHECMFPKKEQKGSLDANKLRAFRLTKAQNKDYDAAILPATVSYWRSEK